MFYNLAKRALDIFVSLIVFVFFWPVLSLIAIIIKLEDGDEVIYSQKRVGKSGQIFRLYKFRSMVENADEILQTTPELYQQMRSGSHKVVDDPRITRVGRIIRKYSLDELPQFWNVLKGEMSFVGPRAIQPDEMEKYQRQHPENGLSLKLILSVKPGITGLWQVTARSTVSFDERISIEAEYAKKKSLLLDFWIILQTPLAVIAAKGAL